MLAVEAAELLQLDRLFIVPTGIQPLKSDKTDGATPDQRLAMAGLAFEGLDGVEVDESECRRPGLSFTVDTLENYAKEYSGATLFLLVGRDSYDSLGKWKNPQRIRELAKIVILERGDGDAAEDGGVSVVSTRRIDVSSSEIRSRRRGGKSIAGFVPDSVLKYIESNNLYAPNGASQE